MKRPLISILLLLLTTGCALLAQQPRVITTVILVRHAEKAGPSGDVPLSAAGIERAKELDRVLSGVDVAAIISTPYQRTLQTIAPIVSREGIEPMVVKTGETYARDVVALILNSYRGKTVVVRDRKFQG